MKRKKPRKQAARRPMLPIKTTIDFSEGGIPLERLGEITKLLKGRHLGAVSKVQAGFVPMVRPLRGPARAEQSLD